MDVFEAKVRKFVDHNRFLSIGVLLSVLMCFSQFGCQGLVENPFGEGKIGRAALSVLVSEKKDDLEKAFGELKEKAENLGDVAKETFEELKDEETLVNNLVNTAGTAILNQVGVGNTPLAVLISVLVGAGLGVDNRRKDKLIKNMKTSAKE